MSRDQARILAAREAGPFRDLADFCKRTRLPRLLVEHLIQAGALDGPGLSRRELIWRLGELDYRESALDLVFPLEEATLPELTAAEALGMEYGMLGLSTGEHPMSFYRERLTAKGILDSAGVKACENGQKVRAAGMAVVHQSPPTAKGMHFLTLEDEAGFINVVIPPQVYRRYRRVIRGAAFLVVQGMVESKGNVTNLKAQRIRSLLPVAASEAPT